MIDLALDSRLFLYDEVDWGLQELDLILNTENTELITDYRYGSNMYQFLWQLNPSVDGIKNYIQEKIKSCRYLSKYNVDVNVSILDGELRNIYYVKISVYMGNDVKYREYQFR
jgi:hypothetical protein